MNKGRLEAPTRHLAISLRENLSNVVSHVWVVPLQVARVLARILYRVVGYLNSTAARSAAKTAEICSLRGPRARFPAFSACGSSSPRTATKIHKGFQFMERR